MRVFYPFLLLVMCLPLAAQEEPRDLEVRTLCFSYSSGLKELSLAGDLEGKSQSEVQLKKYLGNEVLELTLLGDRLLVGKPGEEGFQAWETVAIPQSLREVLLVFFPNNDSKKPYRVMAFDDSAKAFPLGSFYLANRSSSSLRFIVGEEPYEVKPGKSKLLSEFKNKKANGQVSYYAYYQEGKDWRRLSTGFWTVVERKRTFQIAYENAKTGRLELRGYSDGFPAYKKLLQEQEARK